MNMQTEKVQVQILLATYNGEAYLREQLDSLLQQTEKSFTVLARDDGSTDSTKEILREYAGRFPEKIRVIMPKQNSEGRTEKERHGPAANFMALVSAAEAPYVMFCDQDDFWQPEKLAKMLSAMKRAEEEQGSGEKNMPLMVYSDYQLADAGLKPIAGREKGLAVYRPRLDLNHLLVQNCVNGCGMMLNRAAYQILGEYDPAMLLHDWWAVLCVAATGKIIHLEDKLMLYRQHGRNEVSAQDVRSAAYRIRLMTDGGNGGRMQGYFRQAELLWKRLGGQMPPGQKKILMDFLAIPGCGKLSRMYRLLRGKYVKSDWVRTLGELLFV